MTKTFVHNEFTVRVVCMTYNHAAYITDAMNGFVMQQTSFPFVCAIIDDASIDHEQEVIKAYLNTYFEYETEGTYDIDTDYGHVSYARHKANKNCFFVVVFLKENHYSKKKKKYPYIASWSDVKYSALCEGDDYWTDPLKLQKQVDYLEYHPDCMLTVHSANWRTGEDVYPYGCQAPSSKDFSVEELIRCGGYYFATASFVYRSELRREQPEWRRKAGVGDFPLQIVAGLNGEVHYFPDRMCVYRYQSEGSWSVRQHLKEANIAFQKNKIEWMTLLNEATGKKYQKAIYDQLFMHYNSLFNLHEIGLWEYVLAVHKSGQKRYGRLIKDVLRIKLSPIYQFLNCFNKKKN